MPYRLSVLAEWIGGIVEGDEDVEIEGLAKIEEALPGHLSFISNPKYAKFIDQSKASAILVGKDFPATDRTVIRVDDPYFSFLHLVKILHPTSITPDAGIHPSSIIGEGTILGENISIGAHVVIGRNCRIGDGVVFRPGVVIEDQAIIGDRALLYANVCVGERCRIGSDVIIHIGAVIGSDGFGFAFKDGKYHKIPQTGIVVIEDDAESGASTHVAREAL